MTVTIRLRAALVSVITVDRGGLPPRGKPHGGSTAASLGVGALFAAVAVAVEGVLRLRMRWIDRRDAGRTAPPES
jgi:hypothetical protein